MVYAPGGYSFVDYIKFGLPLQIVCFIFTVAIVFSLDHWWAYAVVFAFASPAVVGVYFVCGGHRASSAEAEAQAVETETDKVVAIENGSSTQNIALLPVHAGDNTHTSAESDVIFKGSA